MSVGSIVLIVSFCISLQNQFYNTVLGVEFQNLKFQLSALGLHLSVFSLGAILTRLCMLRWMNQRNMRIFCRVGMSILFLSSMGYAFIHSGNGLMASRFLQGIGFGITSSIIPTVAIQKMNSDTKGVSRIGSVSVLAAMTGPVLSTFLYEKSGFRSVCVVTVGMMAVCLLFSSSFFEKTELVVADAEAVPSKEKFSWKDRKNHEIFFCLCYFGMILIVMNCYMGLIAVFAKSAGSLFYASVFCTVGSGSSIVARMWLEKHVDDRKKISMLICISGIVYGIGIAALVYLQRPVLFAVSGMVQGAFSGIFMSMMQLKLLNKSVYTKEKTNTFFYLTQDIAFIFCGIVWALVSKYAGLEQSFLISGVLLVLTLGISNKVCCK